METKYTIKVNATSYTLRIVASDANGKVICIGVPSWGENEFYVSRGFNSTSDAVFKFSSLYEFGKLVSLFLGVPYVESDYGYSVDVTGCESILDYLQDSYSSLKIEDGYLRLITNMREVNIFAHGVHLKTIRSK